MLPKIDYSQFLSLAKYAANCSVVLLSKLAITKFFSLVVSAPSAYLITHFFTFFISYEIHRGSTFAAKRSRENLFAYFKTVIAFKALDYFIFTVLFVRYDIAASVSIIAATILIFLVRFFFVRRVFDKTTTRSQ